MLNTTSTTVLSDRKKVLAALPALRTEILDRLQEPGSASSLARDLGLPRQKVNYHLRQLEEHGLVRLVAEKPRRGLTERLFVATAQRVLIDPELLNKAAMPADPNGSYAAEKLAATAARTVHEIGRLMNAAAESEQRLATFTLDSEMTFATPGDLREFVAELGSLIARFDKPAAASGRRHRFVAMSHPILTAQEQTND